MLRGDWHVGACCIASLYLAFGEWNCAPLRRWPLVVDALTEGAGDGLGDLSGCLRRRQLWEEAALVNEPGRLAQTEIHVDRGEVLTVFDAAYPAGWLDALGSAAPPAVWKQGDLPRVDLVGVVGSRELPMEAHRFAVELGEYLVASGRGVVSGGASGADRLGVAGALRASGNAGVVEILPFGLDTWREDRALRQHAAGRRGGDEVCLISPFMREARFTGGQAMQRNRLIYAWSRRSVVCHSRLQVGGTWGGATDALRRGLGDVIVAAWGDASSEGLCALGGSRLRLTEGWRSELGYRLCRPISTAQPDLFGFNVIREKLAHYFG